MFVFLLLGGMGYLALGDRYTPELIIMRKEYDGKNKISEIVFKSAVLLFFILNSMGLAILNPSIRDGLYFIKIKNERMKFIILSITPFAIICLLSFISP